MSNFIHKSILIFFSILSLATSSEAEIWLFGGTWEASGMHENSALAEPLAKQLTLAVTIFDMDTAPSFLPHDTPPLQTLPADALHSPWAAFDVGLESVTVAFTPMRADENKQPTSDATLPSVAVHDVIVDLNNRIPEPQVHQGQMSPPPQVNVVNVDDLLRRLDAMTNFLDQIGVPARNLPAATRNVE